MTPRPFHPPKHPAARRPTWIRAGLLAVVVLGLSLAGYRWSLRRPAHPPWSDWPAQGFAAQGLTYTNYRSAAEPWSIHVVRWPRAQATLHLLTAHANGGALGLAPLTDQLQTLDPSLGRAVAAVNGDFYDRHPPYDGDPRGLQILEGELISAPSGGRSFWLDPSGNPRSDPVESRFAVTWPDGTTEPFGLNERRAPDAVVLYTAAAGASTHTEGGRELVLEPVPGGPWLPLRPSQTYPARIREIRETGDTPLPSGVAVLSLGPRAAARISALTTGAILQFATASSPDLPGVTTAIGGGPQVVKAGQAQEIILPGSESYQFTSMIERHPRSAIGWNDHTYFLVEVDGRQPQLSVGMTLEELGRLLAGLGCQEALSLDGGGSATLWVDGHVRNRPCDGRERPIANCLVIARRESPPALPQP